MTSPRQKKSGWILPEEIIGHELICASLCIPDVPEYRQAFLGALNQLTHWYNWQKSYTEGDTRAADAATYWRALIEETLCIDYQNTEVTMSGCGCGSNKETRFTEDGVFQIKNPSSGEWEDAPNSDPREGTPEPPRLIGEPSDSLRCAAADNVRDSYKQFRDTIISLLSGSALVTAIVAGLIGLLSVLLFSTVVGTAVAVIIWGMAAAAFALGSEGVSEQLTDDVMDEFKCLVYNRLNESGELDYDGWQGLIGDIDGHFTDFPETFFHALTAALGYRGIIAAGAAGSNSADDCDCGVCGFSTSAASGNWEKWVEIEDVLDPGYFGGSPAVRQDNGVIFYSNGYGSMPYQYIGILTEFDDPCMVSLVRVNPQGSFNSNQLVVGYRIGGTWTIALNITNANTSSAPWEATIGYEVDAIQIQYASDGSGIQGVDIE